VVFRPPDLLVEAATTPSRPHQKRVVGGGQVIIESAWRRVDPQWTPVVETGASADLALRLPPAVVPPGL